MTKEDYLIYLLAHHAKHYYVGGSGIRSVLDVYLYNQSCSSEWNEEYVETVLQKLQLSQFRSEMTELGEAWFGCGMEGNLEVSPEMVAYIYGSGTYGTVENSVKNALNSNTCVRKKKSKLQYCLGRLYKPYEILCLQYPVLEKYAVLYPICWVHLFGKAMIGKDGRVRRELKMVWGRK